VPSDPDRPEPEVDEYREHVLALSAELREVQRDAGMPEHDCPICQKAEAGPETEDVPL
jgi:hypothetical protein